MKPTQIFDIMDLTRRVREQHKTLNPLFVGPAGVGKSQIVQQWCRKNELPFIDLRAAYLEPSDLIGFPNIGIKDGRQVTKFFPPEMWPTGGEGVILLEEVNRGTTAVMNCFMQLLTDRKIHDVVIPDGWMIVGCVNPENEHNDVNTMDSALKNRFVIFDIDYDKKAFVDYMKNKNWDETVQLFVESNTWTYVKPENMTENPGAKYVSSRSLEFLNNVEQAEVADVLQMDIYKSILGDNYGKAFYTFKHKEQPVLYKDLVDSPRAALKRLGKFADPSNYKNGHIAITIKDIIEKKMIEDDLLVEVLLVLPADQAKTLLSELEFVRKDNALTQKIFSEYPKVKDHLRKNLMVG